MERAIIPYQNTLIPWIFTWRIRNPVERKKYYQLFLQQEHPEINLYYVNKWIDYYTNTVMDNLIYDFDQIMSIKN